MNSIDPGILEEVKIVNKIPVVPKLLEVICRTTGMGFAAIARVTDKNWVTCSVLDEINFGLKPGDELKLETTICNEIRQSNQLVVIDHVEKDPDFFNHPTPLMYGFQSYISVPIFRKTGSFFGTLCAIDPKPARLKNEETIGMFQLFSELISFHLESLEKLETSETDLREEQEEGILREEFIAILAHDLRNPIAAIANGTELLLSDPTNKEVAKIARILHSCVNKMTNLVNNLLDFARGRLGSGLMLDFVYTEQLGPLMQQVIDEFKIISPQKNIESDIHLQSPVFCDPKRIEQLLANLLRNAIIHGAAGTPVRVIAVTTGNNFKLSVYNFGEVIPADKLQNLFQPFYKGKERQTKQGLGLGLYIASEIARAHEGELSVTSLNGETCFTLEIPLKPLHK